MPVRRRNGAMFAAAVAFLACPAIASADIDVSVSGGTITIAADADGNTVAVRTPAPPGANSDGKTVEMDFSSNTGPTPPTVNTSGPCGAFGSGPFVTRVSCTLDTPLARVNANLQAGNDRIARGEGLDRANHAWRLNVDLAEGDDVLDVIRRAGGTSAIGGSGYDEVSYNICADCESGVTASLAGPAGPDSLGTEFESLHGSSGNDDLTGTARTSFPDAPLGNEVEEIEGNGGDDTIDDGGGPDQVGAFSGNDSIVTADGVADDVDCGSGTDEVDADAIDNVQSCEANAETAVTVAFTSGPTGTVRSRDAVFEFTAQDPSPPPGRFECRLDSNPAGFSPCSSPSSLTGVAEGDHVFEVRYDPDSREPGPAAERRWTVEPCPEMPKVGFALPDGCFTETEPGSGVFETTERAFVGGFEILPRPGGSLMVDTGADTLSTAGAGADVIFVGFAVPIPVAAIPVGTQDATFEIGQPGTAFASILDFPVESTVKVAWSGDGKSAAYEQEVKVQEATAGIGEFVSLAPEEGLGESAGKLKAKLENGTGFVLEQAEIAINEVRVMPRRLTTRKTLKLKNLLLKFERRGGKPFWTGRAGIGLPLSRGELDFTGTVFAFDGSFAGGGFEVDGINKRVLGPLFLQKVGGDMAFVPIASPPPGVIAAPEFGYDLRIGATVGPRVDGKKLVTLDGTIQGGSLVADCEENVRRPDPTKLQAVAKLGPLEELEQSGFADVNVTTRACIYPGTGQEAAAIEGVIDGEISLANNAFGYKGTQTGFISEVGASYEGSVLVRLPAVPDLEGSAIVSSVGVAACTDIVPGVEGGFGHQWGSGGADFLEGCDLGEFRLLQAPPSPRSSAGEVPGSFRVAKGTPHIAIAATAAGGAPRVEVSGPGGFSMASPADGGPLLDQNAAVIPFERERTTYVIVDDPRPGRWRVESADPANPLSKVELGEGLPEPKVKAKVVRSRGKKGGGGFRLAYSVRRIPGQEVVFTERGTGIGNELGPARSARGSISFKPAIAADRARTIEAEVVQDGLPREVVTVARFKAPPPPKLRKPELEAKRKGGALRLSWDRVKGASEYELEVSAAGELVDRLVTERSKLRLDGVPAGKLVVTARALSEALPPGPVARLVVRD